jgi:GAF domain-containing protein
MRRVAIVGANKEGLALLPVLDRDPNVKVALIADRNPDALVFKLDALGYRLASRYQVTVVPTLDALAEAADLDVVIDASHDPETGAAIQQKKPPRATVMSALSARLLWGTKDPTAAVRDQSAERQSALFTGLSEIIGAVNLASNQEELLSLVLSVAIESTGAHRGSLLLLDPDEQVLRVRVAEGIDPYVIPTIRVPLGDGISGKVAKEGMPLRISGPANPTLTGAHHIREDVAAALCVPLRAGDGRVIGVLNVHHRTDPDAFTDEDLAFLTRLAMLEAQIISRSQEFARLRGVAARFDAYREFRERLDAEGTLAERLDGICRSVAARLPGGTCTVHRYDPEAELLVVEGTSQAGAGAPWARGARMSLGHGLEGAVVRERRERRLVDPEGGGLVLATPLLTKSSAEGVLVITATEGSDGAAVELSRELKPLLADTLRREREQAAAAGKATKLAAITEAGLSILTAPGLDELGRVVAASAAMVLEADLAVVRIRE